MKLCDKMVEAGQTYNTTNQLFLSGLAELSMHHKTDGVISVRSNMRRSCHINVILTGVVFQQSVATGVVLKPVTPSDEAPLLMLGPRLWRGGVEDHRLGLS